MRNFRFSIRAIMGLVVLVAVGFAALRNPTLLWSSVVFTGTVALMSVALLGAIAIQGRSRLPWLGFATFGWIYLLTTFGLWSEKNGVSAPPYLTKHLMDASVPLHGIGRNSFESYDAQPVGERLDHAGLLPAGAGASGQLFRIPEYRRICHTLTACLLGVVGAFVGRYLAQRDAESTS